MQSIISSLAGWDTFADVDAQPTARRVRDSTIVLWRPNEPIGVSVDGGSTYRWDCQSSRNIAEANRRAALWITVMRAEESERERRRTLRRREYCDGEALRRSLARISLRSLARALGVVGPLVGPEDSLRCRCPIHQGKALSFALRRHSGHIFWRCWSACGEGGDVFELVMRLRGMGFRAAVVELELIASAHGSRAA